MFITISKEKILAVIGAAGLTAIVVIGQHFLGNHFAEIMGIILAVELVVLLSILIVWAGFTVLKALFVVAAELSLLVFLAQSYCDVPKRAAAGNAALAGLVAVGLLYIAVAFIRSLWNAVKEKCKEIENEKGRKGKTLVLGLYLVFIVLFVTQIYQVVAPIIHNLCIYDTVRQAEPVVTSPNP